MKKIVSVLAVMIMGCTAVFAQGKGVDSSEEKNLLTIGDGPFTTEFVSYFAFGDHSFLGASGDFEKASNNRSTEFVFNIIELRLRPYQGAKISLGVDFDWDYYRLSKDYYWQPDSNNGSVAIAARDAGGFSKIKKSNLNVRTLSVPLSFEQDFGKCTFRIGAAGEYNFPARTRFKAIDNNGAKVKETRSGARFADNIKTNDFTYNIFAAFAFEGVGVYVKYNPMPQIMEGSGPQFKTLTFGVICGLGK